MHALSRAFTFLAKGFIFEKIQVRALGIESKHKSTFLLTSRPLTVSHQNYILYFSGILFLRKQCQTHVLKYPYDKFIGF